MPRQENKKQLVVKMEREPVNGEIFDVLKIDGQEIVAFHVTNIDRLGLEHNNKTMADAVVDYLTKK